MTALKLIQNIKVNDNASVVETELFLVGLLPKWY